MRSYLIGASFAILCPVPYMAAASTAIQAGTVVAVSGASSVHGRILRRGDAVQVKDVIDVPPGGHVRLQLTDGSVILIAPGSNLTLANCDLGGTNRHTRLSLAQGLLRAHVAPFRGASAFEVSTPVGTASVRSSAADWFIKAQTNFAQVGVLTGTVNLTGAATRRAVSIPAHWGTRLEAGRDPVLPRVWAQVEFNAVIHLTECCQPSAPKIETVHPPNR